jgi:hypothetical protein
LILLLSVLSPGELSGDKTDSFASRVLGKIRIGPQRQSR